MSLGSRVAAALGAPVEKLTPLHGGDLSEVTRADLGDGRRAVAKTGPMVQAEARMLQRMATAGAPVPEVLHAETGLLLLDWLEETSPTPDGWQALGVGLAHLHATTGDSYGWDEDYAFGAVEIRNASARTWPEFWADRRLRPFVSALPPEAAQRLERLCTRLPDLLPDMPPPALLHGDIWVGNALFSGPRAYFIDPACYHGDAEVDLAMLTLFGQPHPELWDGYGPLRDGSETRRPVYQLWPALVHLRLFGAGYLGLVSRLLTRCGV